jgi:hypothetical protein
MIVSDNGTDLPQMPSWHCSRNRCRVALHRPMRRCRVGFVERFNGRLRDECLNGHLFANLTKRETASKNGGSTTTPIDRTRASNELTSPEFAVRPVRGIIGTGSPYKQGQLREQVKWTLLASPGRKLSRQRRYSPFHILFPPIVAVLPRRERAPLGFSYLSRGASAL